MKLLLILLLLIAKSSSSQGVKVQLYKDSSGIENVYILKIYNDTSVFIGLKCSVSFRFFSEDSILRVAMANWFGSNDEKSVYSIDCSEEDAQFSHFYSYQVILLAPQTYFIARVNLTDYEKFNKARFKVLFKPIIEDNELTLYSKRKPGKVLMSNNRIAFQEKIINIPTAPHCP